MKVLNAQIEKSKNGEELTREDVINEIKNLQDITYDNIGSTIEGECEQYLYTIDKDFNVIVGQKVTGEEVQGTAIVINKGDYLEKVEIQVVGSLLDGSISNIECLTEGAILTQDRSYSEKVFSVEDNGTYIFRITGSNGRRTKVSCKVSNAIPKKVDLLKAIEDIEFEGINKCKVEGRTGDNVEDEPIIYSLDTILYEGNMILDGTSNFLEYDINLKPGYVYEVGNENDISNGNDFAKNAVVLKVIGDLTIKEGVTLTSIDGDKGGPKGFFIYCTGKIINEGTISMTGKGAYSPGENVYLYKNSNNTYEFIPKYGGIGGESITTTTNEFFKPNKGRGWN